MTAPQTGHDSGHDSGPVQRFGDRAILIELPDLAAVRALHERLLAEPMPGVTEIIPAARTVLLRLPDDADAAAQRAVLRAALALLHQPPTSGGGPNPAAPEIDPVLIPVHYDGPDLAAVAAATGLTPAEVIARHCAPTYTVAFCGFAPGFGYLIGGDPALHVPRRDESRIQVPAGSVAIAGKFSAVYPSASPGGWNLLGHTELRMWDIAANPPGLLAPGTAVRFRAL